MNHLPPLFGSVFVRALLLLGAFVLFGVGCASESGVSARLRPPLDYPAASDAPLGPSKDAQINRAMVGFPRVANPGEETR